MVKNKTLGLLFYLRKDKLNRNGLAPIYLRLIVDGQRSNLSTNRSISPDRWNDEADKARGSNEESKSLNQYLESFKSKVYEHHRDLLEKGKTITAETLHNAILGVGDKRYELVEVFKQHNKEMKQKVGKDFALGTMERYETTLQHIEQFLKSKYKRSDIPLFELNFKFVTDLEHYFKTRSQLQPQFHAEVYP
ncbi:MAG: phage integrase SAM-like domain-containing protein [Chitinophagales bacterium]|nr:phage integrase SAM-like domain-containing protein [Chitinophagales bacterium]